LNWTNRNNSNTAAVLLIWALSNGSVGAVGAAAAEVVEGWIPPYVGRTQQNRGPLAGPRSIAPKAAFKERLSTSTGSN
jgi:hypothetical protein